MKPIELDASRQNLKPRPPGLSDDKYLIVALKEGYALLEAEAKAEASVAKPSVKSSSVIPPPSKVQDALGKMSENPYVRAKIKVLSDMTPLQRNTMERMEAGEIPKDKRYELFCNQISVLGDKLSNLK